MKVRLDQITSVSALGQLKGGQSEAFDLVTLPNGCRHLFKRYNKGTLGAVDASKLLELAEWRENLNKEDRVWLDRNTAWIRHVVFDHGNVVGVLVPLAPEQFWGIKKGHPTPRSAGNLLFQQDSRVECWSISDRIHMLGKFLDAILWFHARNLILGDIQLENLLIGTRRDIYLIDMDNVWPAGKPVFRGHLVNHSWIADWEDGCCTIQTDLHKFARAAAKVLSQNGAALDVAYMKPFVTEAHFDLLDRLWRGCAVQPGLLSLLASQWKRCVTVTGEYFFDPAYATKVPSSEPTSRIREGTPPATDYCAGVNRIGVSGVSEPSQAKSPIPDVQTIVPAITRTAPERAHLPHEVQQPAGNSNGESMAGIVVLGFLEVVICFVVMFFLS